jgi:hypothetical protein
VNTDDSAAALAASISDAPIATNAIFTGRKGQLRLTGNCFSWAERTGHSVGEEEVILGIIRKHCHTGALIVK